MVAVDCGTDFYRWIVDSVREWFDLKIGNNFIIERRCHYGHGGIKEPDLSRRKS